MVGYDNGSQPRIVEGDGSSRRAMQQVQRHSVAPDGGAALHYYERTAGDFGERGQGLGGSDGGRDGDGVYYKIQRDTFFRVQS